MADLPELPEPEYTLTSMMGNFISFRAKGFSHKKGDNLYTADHLRSYAEEAVRLEREACAKLCESYEGTISECMGDIEGILATKIRARSEQGVSP